jgi:hypothetical protein
MAGIASAGRRKTKMFPGFSRTQSFMLGFVVLAVVTLGIGWLGKAMIEAEPTGDLEFWHAGYYRDDAMNRLFTIAFLPSASRPDVTRYAKQLTYTPGHTTVALFYPEGSRIPSLAVTNAASLAEAKEALRGVAGASPWRYATLRNEAGELRLVDCQATPGDPLCRH